MRWLVYLGALLLCAGGADARNPRGATTGVINLPSVAGLHIVGNKILNSLGQTVPLRGVNSSGTEYSAIFNGQANSIWDPGQGTVNAQTMPPQATVNAMLAWEIDVVRVPINESTWLGINGGDAYTSAATYQAGIIAWVNELTSNNIAVVLSNFWAGPGTHLATNSLCGGQFGPLPDADHAPTLWTSLANTFKSNSSVIFDLYNEPLPDNNSDTTQAWTDLRDGSTVSSSNSGCTFSYTSAGTQSLVNAIRATGATNIIDVPGVQFTDSLTQWLTYEPTDPTPAGFSGTWVPQLAASWHTYQGQVCSDTTCYNTYIKPVMNSVPVIANEIGENDCTGTYIDPLMAWMDTNGAPGNYLQWTWLDSQPCASGDPASVLNAKTGDPTITYGSDFRDHLLALTGRQPPPQAPLVKFSATYPFGIVFGASAGTGVFYTASDSTPYYGDVSNTNPGLATDYSSFGPFTPFTTTDTITGTSDPTLYQTGRQGLTGTLTVNVLNGNYQVDYMVAFNQQYNYIGSTVATSPFGQDQSLNNNRVGACVMSNFAGSAFPTIDFVNGSSAYAITPGSGYTNGVYNTVSLTGGSGTGAKGTIYVSGGGVTQVVVTTQGTGYAVNDVLSASFGGGSGFSATIQSIFACPQSPHTSAPAVDVAQVTSYNVTVANQQIVIHPVAAFGPPRKTIFNAVKITKLP